MDNINYYKQIFKRKSFHFFKDTIKISEQELIELKEFISTVKPLDESIKTKIEIVLESETTCKRGGQYCILFYSEIKDYYLRNIGYIGEQIDLYLASKNIGALWYGIGKVSKTKIDNLEFVIMINISKVSESSFRKDMFKSKRKPLNETWSGDTLNIANIVRFTPSACNTQPWICENVDNFLYVYRYKKAGKRGIMPADKVRYYNKIDMGIYLFMLETCLVYEGYSFNKKLFIDNSDDTIEKTLIAKYEYQEGE